MDGTDFIFFSAPHIAVIVIIAASCVLCPVFLKKIPDQYRKMASLAFALLISAADLVRYIILFFTGDISVHAIPLHLCAMAVYICLFHGIFFKDWMGQVLYALCLPGAWCAIIFPGWTNYSFFNVSSVMNFVVHGLIVTYITVQLSWNHILPRPAAIWKPVLFLAATAPIAALMNHFLGTNFMFITYSAPGSPLEFLSRLAGGSHALYLIFFAILTLAGMTVMYLVYELIKRLQH